MKKFASVTVVVPCYRCASSIERAVKSVAEQTLLPAEIILVDDFSDDNTLAILYNIKNKYRGSWIKVASHDKNAGPATARNTGWNLAHEKYISFLDADDSWHPKKIEIQYRWMMLNDYVILSGHAYLEFNKKNINIEKFSEKFKIIKSHQLLLSNILSTPSVMLKREIPYRFKEGKRYSEDFLLWCEIILDKNICSYSEDFLLYLHKAPYGVGGLSADLESMADGEIDTYKQLKYAGKLSSILCNFLLIWSKIKYLRRLILVRN